MVFGKAPKRSFSGPSPDAKLACYRGSTGPVELPAGVPVEVVIVFDQPDAAACAIPATIANMKVVLTAPVQTDGLQEWAIRYELRP